MGFLSLVKFGALIISLLASASGLASVNHVSAKVQEKQHAIQVVNINEADVNALAGLKGVGLKKAQNIIDYREQNGNFNSVDDLEKVRGIGGKFLARLKEKNAGRLTVK